MNSRLIYTNLDESEGVQLSIVIPTYRRAVFLEDSIKSVVSQRDKNKIKYEIVIINNDPTDDMKYLIEKYGDENISVYSNEENYGQVGNINQGIKLAKGKYVALLHDDDMLLDNYFSVIHKYISDDSKIHFDCVITSNYQMHKVYRFDIKHKLLRMMFFYRLFYRKTETSVYPKDNVMALRNVYSVPTCGMLLRKSSIEKFGYFRDERGSAWDYYNLRQFNKQYNVLIEHEYVAIRRMYTGMSNIDKIQEEFKKEKLSMIEENSSSKYVSFFGKGFVLRKPCWIFFVAYVISTVYYYSNNLDVDKELPRSLFKDLIEGGIFKL